MGVPEAQGWAATCRGLCRCSLSPAGREAWAGTSPLAFQNGSPHPVTTSWAGHVPASGVQSCAYTTRVCLARYWQRRAVRNRNAAWPLRDIGTTSAAVGWTLSPKAASPQSCLWALARRGQRLITPHLPAGDLTPTLSPQNTFPLSSLLGLQVLLPQGLNVLLVPTPTAHDPQGGSLLALPGLPKPRQRASPRIAGRRGPVVTPVRCGLLTPGKRPGRRAEAAFSSHGQLARSVGFIPRLGEGPSPSPVCTKIDGKGRKAPTVC